MNWDALRPAVMKVDCWRSSFATSRNKFVLARAQAPVRAHEDHRGPAPRAPLQERVGEIQRVGGDRAQHGASLACA